MTLVGKLKNKGMFDTLISRQNFKKKLVYVCVLVIPSSILLLFIVLIIADGWIVKSGRKANKCREH